MTPEDIQRQVVEFEQALTGRKDLTDHAKRVTAARNRAAAGQKLQQLKETAQQQRADIRAKADRALYGNTGSTDPNALMLRRDARERAGRLTEHRELRQAFNEAQRDGDTVMAQALAARARDMWAHDIVSDYVASNPTAQRALEAEAELPRENENFNLHEAAHYSLPPATGVLNGMQDWQINSLAADDDIEVA
ncbi:hypothetical protein [Streptomyces mesophilus]|uniref:hypothetical protein n=1 Tax=Streptomyces mesophilus TaxID=1775132 RepID=UPI00332A51CC